MPIDLSKIKNKLVPKPDGEDELRLRVGLVVTVNSNGTADVAISGVTVPSVPILSGAVVTADLPVQILSYRGSLLIIGSTLGTSGGSGGLGIWARGQQTTNSATISGTTPVSLGLVTNTVTFLKNRVYECRTHGGLSTDTTNTYGDLRPFRSAAATQLGEYYRYPLPASTIAYNGGGAGIYFTTTVNVSGAVALYGATGAGNMTHRAAAGTPRNIEVWDVGDISQFTGVVNW